MGLSRYKVRSSIAVSDIARAAQFYEGKLGLEAREEQSDESRIYLGSKGVKFERYDGNTFAIEEGTAP
jgi:catechol 2,3-dioxygenase-like lactoylglutathione lyase family enzyme